MEVFGQAEVFEQVSETLETRGASAGFDLLVERFLEQKNYPLIFEARLMKMRHELGLPLIQTESFQGLSAETQAAYEQATTDAAREVGDLFLGAGDVQRAWPYFRAIGEPKAVRDAIDSFETEEADDALDGVVAVAYHEQVHPEKGFALILQHYGVCRAITNFSQYPAEEGRADCAHLLIETLYKELVANVRYAIEQKATEQAQDADPRSEDLAELVAERAWLFEGNAYYLDTSHVSSVVQMSQSIDRPATLELLLGLTEYGKRLGEMYQFPGNPPFENVFEDYGAYLRTVLGHEVEAGLDHFRNKIETCDPQVAGTAPAQTLVNLLVKIGRLDDAIDVALEHLKDADPQFLSCPNALQLCQMAGDFSRLTTMAKERNDLLSYTAARLQEAALESAP